MPGIPELAVKEDAGQGALHFPLSQPVGKCNGAAGSVDLPKGHVAPGRYGELWLWWGSQLSSEGDCCLWALWGQDSNPVASLGPGSSSWDAGQG